MEPEPPTPADALPPPPLGPFQFTLRSLMLAGTALAVCLSAIKTLNMSLAYIALAAVISLAVLVCRSWRDPLKIVLLAAVPTLILAVCAGWVYYPSRVYNASPHFSPHRGFAAADRAAGGRTGG